jgi:hypothetical protein
MKKKFKERLKDIIIDHIYHYCYNEIVRKIKGDNAQMTFDVESKIEDDSVLKKIYDEILKSSSSIKMFYDARNQSYCKVVDGVIVQKSFMERLLAQGFKKSERLNLDIEEALTFLVHRSYITRNQPIENEVSLTQKGINHYTSGNSFEDKFIKGRNAKIALIISIISIAIAFCAFLISLFNNNAT